MLRAGLFIIAPRVSKRQKPGRPLEHKMNEAKVRRE